MKKRKTEIHKAVLEKHSLWDLAQGKKFILVLVQRDCPVLQRPLSLIMGGITFIILRAHKKCDSLGGPVPVTWSLDPNPYEMKTLPVSALDSRLSDFGLKGNVFAGVS